MIISIKTSQGTIGVPAEFSANLAELVLSAGWEIAGPKWMPARKDRFVREVNGVTYALQVIENYLGKPGLTYRVGLSTFVDGCYGEYCNHYRSLDVALQSV